MAKLYKKIQHKTHPKKKEPDKPREGIGRDYLLIFLICFTTIVLGLNWEAFNAINRAMYLLLLISLSLTYLRRHKELTETQQMVVDRAGLVSIGFAAALFFISVYEQYFAG